MSRPIHRFNVRPTGATYASRFQSLDDAPFGFVLVNDYIRFSAPATTYQLTQGARPENIAVAALYKSHAPVKIAANVFCDPRDCGEDASAQGRYVLSNRYAANLFPASSSETRADLSIRLAKKISDGTWPNSTSWRWRLQLTMGTYDEGTNTWVQTIGRSRGDSYVLPFASPGAATGQLAAAGDDEAGRTREHAANVGYDSADVPAGEVAVEVGRVEESGSSNGMSAGPSTTDIATAALGVALVAAVAAAMVAARRRQRAAQNLVVSASTATTAAAAV